jgi:predicted ATPase
VSPVPASTLPRPTSSFVGRDVEIGEVTRLVRDSGRLLTLTGPGGSGKSRLAIAAASRLSDGFDDGVFWVSLSVLRDPRLLSTTLANALGAIDELADHIGARRLLLVLDNFEQIVEAAPEVLELLEACPNLHVLVTSRERLRVAGETEYPVPPLTAPEAIELFCTRARTPADATIAELCDRLDNLPLALELAAARTTVLSPRQILSRLADRLDLFRGDRGGEARQQTLRAAIEWSCQLLDEPDLQLFTRLAVFEGGCGVEAAERVAGADVDHLQSLVDKSLVRHSGERFWMLETIREYAVELLNRSPDAGSMRARHLAWCIDFLHDAERQLPRGHSDLAGAMEQEFGNIRAAVQWSTETGQIESALQLVRPRLFWQSVQSHSSEGCEWIETLLEQADHVAPELRAKVLRTAGDLRRTRGDLAGARSALQQALELIQTLDDDSAIAETAYSLGRVDLTVGAYDRADEVTQDGLRAAHAAGSELVVAELTAQLADIAYRLGRDVDARSIASEALGLAASVGDAHTESEALRVLAMLERDQGDAEAARAQAARSLSLIRMVSDTYCLSVVLGVAGAIELQDGLPGPARANFTEALELQRSMGQWHSAADSFWGIAAAFVGSGELERGARLLGAEQRLRAESGAPFQAGSQHQVDDVWRDLRSRADEEAVAGWVRAGELMTTDDALALALAYDEPEASLANGAAGADEAAGADGAVRADTVGASALRREGDYWSVTFDGHGFRLRHSKGVDYLALLLQSPGREFHSLDLAGGVLADPATRGGYAGIDPADAQIASGDAGPVLDGPAKSSYRARLLELQEELEEATSWSDVGRTTRIKDEMEFLAHELTGAMGLGGRDRKAASDAERARVNITRAIRSTVDRIRKYDKPFAGHLDATVHTGMYCSYNPDPRTAVSWAPVPDDGDKVTRPAPQ